MANVAEVSLIDESKKVMNGIISPNDTKKVEFVPLPFEMKLTESGKDKTNGETSLSSKRNQLETSLASYGFVFDNTTTESMATAQFSLQNSVNMMGTYYENVNVSFANNSSGYSNAIFLPYLSYGGGLDNNQLNYIPIAFPNYEEIGDAPEFIDISEMPMKLRNDDSLKGKNFDKCKNDGGVDEGKISSDDDIIFVGSYVNSANKSCENNEDEDKPDPTKKADGNRKPRKKVNVVAERKNPKRMTRSCRASESLALKLSIPQKVFNAKVKPNCQQNKNPRITKSEDCDKQEKKPVSKTPKKYKPKKTYSRRKICYNTKTKAKTSALLTRLKLVELLHETSEACVNFVDNIKSCHQLTGEVDDEVKEENLKVAAEVMTNSVVLEEFFKKFA